MDFRFENLQLFCANLQLTLSAGQPVQGGIQYTVSNGRDNAYITLYNSGTCYARGVDSDLLLLLRVWCDNSYTNNSLHPGFAESWREWNTNAQFLRDAHQQLGGVPDETIATDEYKQNREILFHDYMLAENRHGDVTLEAISFVVTNWLKRFCFMNVNPNLVLDKAFRYLQDNCPPGGLGDRVPYSFAAEALSVSFVGACHSKYFSCSGGCPFRDDPYDCIKELVDMLYMYCEHPRVISYNRTNLQKILSGRRDVSWTSIDPSTPIEEKMKQALFDAGLLTVPQYQALAPTRHYRVDYLIPTPNGGRLAIECDGLQYHATTTSYISDRRRDNLLLQNGITPVRFSSVDIDTDINGCISTIETLFSSYQTGRQVYHRNNSFGYFNSNE